MGKYKLCILLVLCLTLVIPSLALSLDKFMSYRNYSSTQGEDIPVTPDENYAIRQGYINTYELTASAAKAITVPTGAKFAIFSATADIWVNASGTTAAIPSGDTTDGTGSELNPIIRYIGGSSTISVISAYAAKMSIMFYN